MEAFGGFIKTYFQNSSTRICFKIPFKNVMRHFWKRFKMADQFENPWPKRQNNTAEPGVQPKYPL
ncbi:hypothetical protein LEP1GSC193_2263 [Leptospira alstonii serovar Pingchang str. 80-412]|uniref:Uncharacterized protein n=2 Tax=Leptospira alstonii TaxID=28452 RepID=M6CWQ4_9LEPT|nr:hypothetical protein LEP1GSC194_0332 [Leptospira alstonii serovar Sichuan str. 79601]EQA79927.1 hypothetical protein LEP1GSC193_2263 [Leptospira alstonii serovar Pingchang str. 80-412]